MRQIEVINQETIIDVSAEVTNVEILVTNYDDDLVEKFALEAQLAAIAAEASATAASESASEAANDADVATNQALLASAARLNAQNAANAAEASEDAAALSASSALASATSAELDAIATAADRVQTGLDRVATGSDRVQTGLDRIATGADRVQTGIDSNTALTQAGVATTQAGIATTQAGIATTQAGNALTSANNALNSANAAAASAASAAQVGTSTLLTGFATGANTTIAGTDTILGAFQKAQGQINARVSSNIFTADGTLVSNRAVTMGGFRLDFVGSSFTNRMSSAGRLLLGNPTESTFLLDVLGATRLNGLATIQGTTASDSGQLGSELLTTGSSDASWTGTSFATGYTHVVGSVTTLTSTLAGVVNTFYQISYTVTGRTAGSFTIAFGGQSFADLTATGAVGPMATTTGTLVITPTTDFNGTIILSIRVISTSSASISFNSSAGTVTNQIRISSINTNTFLGLDSGRRNTTGGQNTFFGSSSAINNTTGGFNSFFGFSSGFSNTTGSENSFFGRSSGSSNLTGSNNSFFGTGCGESNTTGSLNSFFGFQTGVFNTTGNNNSYFGFAAGRNQTTGSNNVAFGRDAGRLLSTGSNLTIANNSIFIGFNTRANADNETNQLVIGHSAIGLGSNTTVIGNSSTTFGRWWGRLLLGTSTDAGFNLDVNGTARVQGALTTNLTAGRVPFIGTGGVLVDSANFTWDNANIRLSIGGSTDTNSQVTFSRNLSAVNARIISLTNLSTSTNSGADLKFTISTDPNSGAGAIIRVVRTNLNNSGDSYIALLPSLGVSPTEVIRFNPNGNILINTTTDIASSILTIESTSKGFLPPRMTAAQRNAIATPVAGLMVYNTTDNRPSFFNGTSWINL